MVVPGNLVASSSGFANASSGVTDLSVQSMMTASPEGAGITDPAASEAFTRMATIWTKDLDNLANVYETMGSNLFSAGDAYQQTETSTGASFEVSGTSITPSP